MFMFSLHLLKFLSIRDKKGQNTNQKGHAANRMIKG